jgi:hypothetical protein
MGITFSPADYSHTGGSFLHRDICYPPFSQGDFLTHCVDSRVCRQFQRMRGIIAQGIFIQDIFYIMVGDSMRLLYCGYDCAGRGLKLGLLERRSEEAVKDVRIEGTVLQIIPLTFK